MGLIQYVQTVQCVGVVCGGIVKMDVMKWMTNAAALDCHTQQPVTHCLLPAWLAGWLAYLTLLLPHCSLFHHPSIHPSIHPSSHHLTSSHIPNKLVGLPFTHTPPSLQTSTSLAHHLTAYPSDTSAT